MGPTELLIMDIDTEDHPSISQKPHTLPLKHAQWHWVEIEMFGRAGIISWSISPWSHITVTVPKKTQTGQQPLNDYVWITMI